MDDALVGEEEQGEADIVQHGQLLQLGESALAQVVRVVLQVDLPVLEGDLRLVAVVLRQVGADLVAHERQEGALVLQGEAGPAALRAHLLHQTAAPPFREGVVALRLALPLDVVVDADLRHVVVDPVEDRGVPARTDLLLLAPRTDLDRSQDAVETAPALHRHLPAVLGQLLLESEKVVSAGQGFGVRGGV